ncbi:peptide/nickel ABC transporter, permease [Deferribacter desulfuricans SSM1]|uniref:Peptide/nickel ABC transporter, permease n=1 Tax=Deferribacter desulfuricans (strain DSM 14783 / JCM 11476 / NBRC 101012 / SSM1) TaxID=639282 RepID=D3PAM2_DEFDS|nr:nickel transporter permease [Deferribacter desulfuricans]BAI79645.1 peptide/nickel ABC transporter, permease [Deferribacter desulfuricans SSM1]
MGKKGSTLFWVGLVIVVSFFVIAVFAPVIATHDPYKIDLNNIFLPPSKDHLFGTDDLGRDVFSRIVYGSRVSLLVGFISVGISIVIGTAFGLIAGYYGGFIDSMVMRFVDVMLSFPSFFLILAVIGFLKPSLVNVMIVIGLTSWMGVARMVRAEVLSVKERDYVIAAKILGLRTWKILLKHVLPNVFTPIFVTATLGIAGAILTESALSFLGLGVQPPTPSWGNILTVGKDNIMFAWWLSFFPGVAIFLTVLGYNLLGEGLRDLLDPKEEQRK